MLSLLGLSGCCEERFLFLDYNQNRSVVVWNVAALFISYNLQKFMYSLIYFQRPVKLNRSKACKSTEVGQ